MRRTTRIPEEIYIIAAKDKDGLKTLVGVRPFYDRREAELAAASLGNGLEVVGFHIIRSVIID